MKTDPKEEEGGDYESAWFRSSRRGVSFNALPVDARTAPRAILDSLRRDSSSLSQDHELVGDS
jgi:hypothetical protein